MNEDKKTALLSSWIDEAAIITTVSHGRPDGDAAGSSAAMAGYLSACRGKDAEVLLPGPLPESAAFILDGTTNTTDRGDAALRLQRTDLLICLDFNTISRTEELEDLIRAYPGRKVLIDHHEDPEPDSFDLCFSDTRVSSTCELLYRILLAMPDINGDAGRIPAPSARALMAGMTTDTNNFANSVFPGTLRMASELLAAGVDRDDIIDKLYHSERPNRLAAMGDMLSERMKLLPCGAAVTVLPQAFYDRHGLQDGETEGFVNMPLAIKGIRLSVLAREDGPLFRVSIRSRRGTSARLLAKADFHGGGHEQASGGKILIPDDIPSPDSAEKYICDITARFLQQQDTAKN
ncbi:MAG: DHH family phosphoesterase [Bacteroidales bacterium]|nr:DHH family phosphoesterase [Bacteroidales bacterium]